VGWVKRRMRCGGDTGESFEERWRGRVEVFIGNAMDAAVADRTEIVPAALSDDAVERDATSGAAPGEEQNVGVSGGDLVGVGMRAGLAEEAGACGFD
jgi:hypothetical protein